MFKYSRRGWILKEKYDGKQISYTALAICRCCGTGLLLYFFMRLLIINKVTPSARSSKFSDALTACNLPNLFLSEESGDRLSKEWISFLICLMSGWSLKATNTLMIKEMTINARDNLKPDNAMTCLPARMSIRARKERIRRNKK
jgi:hypothetical protein